MALLSGLYVPGGSPEALGESQGEVPEGSGAGQDAGSALERKGELMDRREFLVKSVLMGVAAGAAPALVPVRAFSTIRADKIPASIGVEGQAGVGPSG